MHYIHMQIGQKTVNKIRFQIKIYSAFNVDLFYR